MCSVRVGRVLFLVNKTLQLNSENRKKNIETKNTTQWQPEANSKENQIRLRLAQTQTAIFRSQSSETD